jgi:hypothetical protein
MLTSITDLHTHVRDIVFNRAPEGLRFTFDLDEAQDLGTAQAGSLLEQNADFVLFDVEVIDVRRAGPSDASPQRCHGSLTLELFSKAPLDEVAYGRQLEQLGSWFADQTLLGIRFRSFLPLRRARAHGFVAYRGAINLDFEITKR